MKKYYWGLLIILVLSIIACDNDVVEVTKYNLSGNITFQDVNGDQIDENDQVGIVRLFLANSDSIDYNDSENDYDFVGVDFSLDNVSSYHTRTDWLRETEVSNSYKFSEVTPDNYVIYYEFDDYGWGYQLVNLANNATKDIIIRKSFELFGEINEPITIGPNQHVIMANDIIINPGSGLTILENSIIEIQNGKIVNNGELNIEGSIDKPILITHSEGVYSWERIILEAGSNTNIHHAILLDSQNGFEIKSSSNSISNVAIVNCFGTAVSYKDCDGSFTNNLIHNANDGIEINGSDIICASPDIIRCVINDLKSSENRGIRICNSSQANITDNIINNCSYGIESVREVHNVISTEIAIKYNLITNCSMWGCNFSRTTPILQYNTIRDSRAGVRFLNVDLSFDHNNFENFTFWAVGLFYRSGGNTINANRNWWGTTDIAELSQLMLDESDEPQGDPVGIVTYDIVLTSEVKTAFPRVNND